jgi:hypothetical protein
MRPRHDGFTPERRRAFFEVVTKTGCISDGCRAAGISRTTVNRWRDKDPEFARKLEAALAMASANIDMLAWERGVTGIEEPVIHYGKQVGTRIKRSDSIFRMILMASNPGKYGRMGAVKGRLAPKERAQIEQEMRREIEQEMLDNSGGQYGEALRGLIDRKLSEMNRRMGGNG